VLGNGQVLVAGGGTAAAQLYNPATNAWTATGSMSTARLDAAAALLPDGDVLVTGGGFYAGETVTLLWDSITVVGHAKTTATGSFGTTITIPKATAGAHVIAVRGRRSFAGTAATFTVTSAR